MRLFLSQIKRRSPSSGYRKLLNCSGSISTSLSVSARLRCTTCKHTAVSWSSMSSLASINIMYSLHLPSGAHLVVACACGDQLPKGVSLVRSVQQRIDVRPHDHRMQQPTVVLLEVSVIMTYKSVHFLLAHIMPAFLAFALS